MSRKSISLLCLLALTLLIVPVLFIASSSANPPSPTALSATSIDARSALGLDLVVDHIEVVQVLLADKDPVTGQTIPLIAEKSTMVRVYVRVQAADSVAGVTARLYVREEDGTTHEMNKPINNPITAKNRSLTSHNPELNDTINFRPDPDWLKGKVTFLAEVDPNNTVTESHEKNNQGGDITKTFQPGKKLRIAWTEMLYLDEDDQSGQPIKPDSKVTMQADSYLRKIYPVGNNDVEYFYQPNKLSLSLDFVRCEIKGGFEINCPQKVYLKALNIIWNLTTEHGGWQGGTPPDRLYGWVPEEAGSNGDGLCGVADQRGASGKGRVAVGKDSPICVAKHTFTHEIAHLLNNEELSHAPNEINSDCSSGPRFIDTSYPNYPGVPRGSIGVPGIDVVENKVLQPNRTFDFMSYCSSLWLSPYHYQKLNAGFAPVTREKKPLNGPSRKLLISGMVDKSKLLVEFDPFYEISSLPIDQSDEGSFCLEMQDSNEITINRSCFDMGFIDEESGEPIDIDVFVQTVAYPNNTAKIVLTYDGTPIKEVLVSDNAPTVTLLSANGGETLSRTGTYTVTWSAQDADGDSLHYALFYSMDAGQSWMPIGMDITTTDYTLDLADLPGSSTAMLRVVASDGVNTTADVSDAIFTVESKAPQTVIISPEQDATIPPSPSILLQGTAYDLEDGTLSDESLDWHSNVDGDLGTGGELFTSLSLGEHVITLTSVDQDGNRDAVSLNILVNFFYTYLPVVLRPVPPPAPTPEPTPTPDPTQEYAYQVVELTNNFRKENGCPVLRIDSKLMEAAQRHSEDMANNDFHEHTGSDGSSPGDRLEDAGYKWRTYGENIAAGYRTPADVVNGWINSEGHRNNMLNCRLEGIGVGYHYNSSAFYKRYWTQVMAAEK